MADYSVGEVAAMSGISIRTLHHYDEIGVLVPNSRTAAGHRRYCDDDLARLRRILYYRALDFPLDRIAALLDDPDPGTHLRRQHRLLRQRQARTSDMLAQLDREVEALELGIALSPAQQREIFGTDRFADLLAEAEGTSAQWRVTAVYGEQEWRAIKAEADAVIALFADAIAAQAPVGSESATAAAEQHRQHLERWFFECGPQRHIEIADQYLADPAAAATWDAVAPGFAQYVHDAIVANAAHRHSTS